MSSVTAAQRTAEILTTVTFALAVLGVMLNLNWLIVGGLAGCVVALTVVVQLERHHVQQLQRRQLSR